MKNGAGSGLGGEKSGIKTINNTFFKSRIDRVSKIKLKFVFTAYSPNPGPGRLPLDSGRGNVEIASVFAPVASLTVSVVSECIFWNHVGQTKMKHARATAGKLTHETQNPPRTQNPNLNWPRVILQLEGLPHVFVVVDTPEGVPKNGGGFV